jgi:transcription elongation GreA/GreB family factor
VSIVITVVQETRTEHVLEALRNLASPRALVSDIADDPINGYLMLSSPLGQALSQGSPGDELTYQAGEKERGVLFVSLETVSAQAARERK